MFRNGDVFSFHASAVTAVVSLAQFKITKAFLNFIYHVKIILFVRFNMKLALKSKHTSKNGPQRHLCFRA